MRAFPLQGSVEATGRSLNTGSKNATFCMFTRLIRVSYRPADQRLTCQSKGPVREAAFPQHSSASLPSSVHVSLHSASSLPPLPWFPGYSPYAPSDDPNLDFDFFWVFVKDAQPEGH